MKRNELKKVLKPLIKECIKEVMFEDGVLSGIISEVAQGLNSKQVITDRAPATPLPIRTDAEEQQRVSQKINEARQAMAEAVGKNAYNGVNIFEGTTPMRGAGSATPQPSSPLANVQPSSSFCWMRCGSFSNQCVL